MFKVFAFGFETRNKTISSLIYRLINEALLVADHFFNQMPFQLMDMPRWFMINMFLLFSFSRRLHALMHWCGFHAARGESEWCRTITVTSCCSNSCCQTSVKLLTTFTLSVHHAYTRAPCCSDTRLRTSNQTCGLPIDQTSILQYIIRDMPRRVHSGMHLSETATVVTYHR